MRHPLESRIAALRGQVRRLLAAYGLAWLVLGLVAAVASAGFLDWLIHLVPEVRLALLIGVGGVGSWLLYRRVIAPMVVRFDDLDIALKVEDRWPGLNDRLASTVQFLQNPDDDALGSKALRDATVARTIEETDAIDFRQAIDPRPASRALGWSSSAVAAALLVALLAPTSSRIALDRLFRPFGPTEWPRLTHLTVVEAETARKAARGEPYALAVAVGEGERMPSSARVTYTFADGETSEEPLRAGDDGTFRGRLDAANRDFSFTVAAGDDRTSPWPVKVVPPPVLNKLTVRLAPPAYTGLKVQTLAPGNTQVRAVFGTRVELEGEANKPLASAVLRVGEGHPKEPVALTGGGLAVAARFPAEATAPFWFELRDTEGFRNQEVVRYDLRTVADEAPRVTIDDPATDRDVPARAVVPVRATAEDDYGLHSIRLVYKVSAGGSEPAVEAVLPLWDGQARKGEPPSKREEVAHRWNLADLKLEPGAIVAFHADARDFDDVKGPNVGKSREIRLRVVSDEEINRHFEDQQRALRDDIERALAMQRQAQAPVADAIRMLAKTKELPAPTRDNLRNAETIQRQVTSRVAGKSDGIERKIGKLLDDLKNFNVPNADVERQMVAMRESVERIKDRNLTPAEQDLARADKALDDQSRPPRPGRARDQAPPAGQPRPDADRPRGDEAQAKSKAGEASKSGEQAKAQAGQPKSAEQAKAQAGQPSPGKPGEPAKPGAGEPKPEAGDRAKSSPELALNDAAREQKAIADELKKMLDGLSEFDTVRGVVKDAKAQLQQQEQAMKQSAEAAGKPELAGKSPEALEPEQKGDLENLGARQAELAKGQQNLEAKLDEMAKKLEATDPLAASALKEAAKQSRSRQTAAKMAEAGEQLGKNRMGQARQNQEQARNDLKDMVDTLQNRRERELARLVQELKGAEAELKALRDRQAANLKKTAEAKKIADPKERAKELQKLAKEQAEIRREMKRQLQKLAKLGAEPKAGSKADERMAKAGDDLDQDQGEQAEEDMEEALDNLRQAQREVAQNRREAEEQLALEQISKMADALRSIAERQGKMIGETTGYEKARAGNGGKLSIAQRTGVRDLGQVQAGLKDEAGELIERIGEGAPVFSLTLKRAATAMDDAAGRLRDLKTDEPTVVAERAASNRLKQLIDSLKPEKMKKADGDGGEQGGGGGGGGDGITAAAQIKMLKMLQQEINERTDAFDELARRKKPLSPDQERDLGRLHEDQGELADLVRDMTRPKMPDGEEE